MLLRFPTLSLFTVALFLLSPSLPSSGATPENSNGLTRQTAQNSAPPQTQSTPDRATKAEADRLSQQALQQYQTSQFQGALQSWQQALSLYREMGDRAGEGRTLYNIGEAYDNLGQYPQALEQLQQALDIARAVGDRRSEAAILNELGQAYFYLKQDSQSLEADQQALNLYRTHLTSFIKVKWGTYTL